MSESVELVFSLIKHCRKLNWTQDKPSLIQNKWVQQGIMQNSKNYWSNFLYHIPSFMHLGLGR